MKRNKPSVLNNMDTAAAPDNVHKMSQSLEHHPPKRRRLDHTKPHAAVSVDYFSWLSLESICHILSYLPFYDIMKLECLCRKFSEAITLHLRLINEINFTEGQIYGGMSWKFNDHNFKKLLSRCPQLTTILNLHPANLSKRRHIISETLSVPGIVDAFMECPHLNCVDTSDIFLLEAILTSLPFISCGDFCNRNGHFPVPANNKLNLARSSMITSLQLHGVTITDIPRMDALQHLHLRFVKLTAPQPFQHMVCPQLETFVMAHCAGPPDALKYVPLVTGLAAAEHLWRIELIRVPFLGGLFQHVVEDRWRHSAFRSLEKLSFGACKNALEVDLGYLLIACSGKIRELLLQPSLTKDSFFMSLIWTDVDFLVFESLNLGFVDAFPEVGMWSNGELSSPAHGLADVVELPAMLTDIGMKAAGRAFTYCKNLSIYNAPHLHHPTTWLNPGEEIWAKLRYIHIRRCHAVWLADFCTFVSHLPHLESLYIEDMFREAPRGCARVGLSAGTGLGVSSALVTNTGNEAPQPANQQQPNNAGAEAANQQQDDNNEQEGPANQQQDNNAEPEADNVEVAIEEAANSHEEEVDPEVIEALEEIEKNAAHCSKASDDDLNQPSCSSATPCTVLPEERRESAKDKDVEKDIGNQDEAAMEYDIVTIETGNQKCSHCGGSVPPVGDDDDKESASKGKGKGKGKGKSLRGKKKGITKQSNVNNSKQVHQSCQAIGEEIREASKKAKESEEMNQSQPRTMTGQSESRIHGEDQSNKRRQLRSDSLSKGSSHSGGNKAYCGKMEENGIGRKKKVPVAHKSTSTSDPVLEDDFIPQVLTLRSPTLVNVTLRNVGVTGVTVVDCPCLQLLSATACRVLRRVTVRVGPNVARTSLVQCPRLVLGSAGLRKTGSASSSSSSAGAAPSSSEAPSCEREEENIIHTLLSQPAEKSRLLILRPMDKQYCARGLERQVFSEPSYQYHACVIHDYSPQAADTMYNQRRVGTWLEHFTNISRHLKDYQVDVDQSSMSQDTVDDQYPWGRRLHRLHGHNANGSRWEILTDIPWFPRLASAPDLPRDQLVADDSKPGVYCPRAKGHNAMDVCLEQLALDVAELQEEPRRHDNHTHAVYIYVNMCDVLAASLHERYFATHDPYV